MQVPTKIRCVLFDLDNTLIEIPNTWQYFDEIIMDVIANDYKLPVPTNEERDQLWRSGKGYIQILKEWGIDNHQEFWILFDKRDGVKRKQFIQDNKLIIYNDVIPLLENLMTNPIKVGLITNTPQFIAEMELEAFGLTKYFHTIFGLGDDQTICKPEPDGIYQCLELCKCQSQETLLVGDNTIDLVAAKRAGVCPVLIDRSGQKKVEHQELTENDYIRINNLHIIEKWIKNGYVSKQIFQ